MLVWVPKLVWNALLFHELAILACALCLVRGRRPSALRLSSLRKSSVEEPLLGLNGSLRSIIRAFFFASSADEC